MTALSAPESLSAATGFWAWLVWLFPLLMMGLAAGAGLAMAANTALATVAWTLLAVVVVALRIAAGLDGRGRKAVARA